MSQPAKRALCPLCNHYFPSEEIEDHAWACNGSLKDHIPEEVELPPEQDDSIKCFVCGGVDMSFFHALEVRTRVHIGFELGKKPFSQLRSSGSTSLDGFGIL